MSDESVRSALRSDAALVAVEAPAGCGKTHQGAAYASDIASADDSCRPLILTHTHAACSVFAERTRQTRARVEIRTIDSLIGQIAAAYHVGLGLPPDIAAWVRGRKNGHARLASTVAALLKRHPMIAAAVARRHSVVICDEHQDSSGDQHSVVMAIHHQGSALRVFSDPMQRIFDETTTGGTFAPCDWDSLKDQADALAQLDTPHRWSDGCQDLGRWTLAARRTLRAGGAVDLHSGLIPESVEVLFAENRAPKNLAYQLSSDDRRPVDEFERQHDSLLILTRHNPTAMSLRSLFNRRILLWEGYTRYALDGLVDAIRNADGDCGALAAAVVRFMGDVGKGFSPSVFGKIFEREVREGCSRTHRGRPEKVQELARLLLADPGHHGVSAVLHRLGELATTDPDFADVKIDCNREFWDAIRLDEFETVDEGLAEITHRRNYSRPRPPDRAISIIHKAKGLQCDSAIVMPCNGRTFPDKPIARCLLYVAISRARRRLMLVVSRQDPTPLLII